MTSVGDSIEASNAQWSFGGQVATTFDEHVRRSVPFYSEGHDLVAKIADFFIGESSLVYEIGCSTGELTRALVARNKGKGARFAAIDVVPEMVAEARVRNSAFLNVEILQDDIVEMDLKPTDLIIAYYTMQFVRPRFRQVVFDKIYNALNWGGAFVLFEKVRAPDARFQDLMTTIYTDFKLDQGFSESEIIAKSRSLKGVLEPFSTQGNLDLLKRAGFVDIMTVFKYVTFEGFLAIK